MRMTTDDVLERVLARLEALEGENRAIRAELARLRSPLEAPRERTDTGLSRRRALLTLGGAVAGAAALGRGLADPAPALAGTDGDLALGSVSNSAASPTGLAVSGHSAAYGIGVTDNGLGQYPPEADPAAVFGHSGGQNFYAGVVGYSSTGGIGVEGISHPRSDGGQAAGVSGLGSPGVYGASNTNGPGVRGLGVPGVEALNPTGTVGGVAVHATVSGFYSLIDGPHPATGTGIVAEVIDGGGGAPASASVALLATNEGAGAGVQASSATGTPVIARVTGGGSKETAIKGFGTSRGRGGQFSGGAAQIRLMPAGAVPSSGQTGDLFVDSAGSLHYCKAGGSTATWVKLA